MSMDMDAMSNDIKMLSIGLKNLDTKTDSIQKKLEEHAGLSIAETKSLKNDVETIVNDSAVLKNSLNHTNEQFESFVEASHTLHEHSDIRLEEIHEAYKGLLSKSNDGPFRNILIALSVATWTAVVTATWTFYVLK